MVKYLALGIRGIAAPLAALVMVGAARAQSTNILPVPQTVVDSAVKAVEALGNDVVAGKFETAIQLMNPQWKERMAKRLGNGGEAQIDQRAREMMAEMQRQGIRMLAFKPQGRPQAYEVWPGKSITSANGRQVENLIYTKWMVLIPTVTRLQVTPPGQDKPVVIESNSFQIAVSDKDKNNWTFIDGANATVSELRSLFITLPEDIVLPSVGRRVVDAPASR